MQSLAAKRLVKDLENLKNDDSNYGIMASPCKDILNWIAVIFGPKSTSWEDGTFVLKLRFSKHYPNQPPKIKFLSKVFHPNVYVDGAICLDLLQNNWSPIYDVNAILCSIQSLLSDPNPRSPANSAAAILFSDNIQEYEKRVESSVELSWGLIENLDNPEEIINFD